jgi:hypothetical protein
MLHLCGRGQRQLNKWWIIGVYYSGGNRDGHPVAPLRGPVPALCWPRVAKAFAGLRPLHYPLPPPGVAQS